MLNILGAIVVLLMFGLLFFNNFTVKFNIHYIIKTALKWVVLILFFCYIYVFLFQQF